MPRPSDHNPFTPNQPIQEEERFFGRDDALEWPIDRFLAGERFVVVYGARLIGKTSLLVRMAQKYTTRGTTAYVDLEALPNASARELLWSIVAEVHGLASEGGAATLSREAFLSQDDYLRREVLPLWREAFRDHPLFLLLDGPDLALLQEGNWADLVFRLREIVEREPGLRVVLSVRGVSTQAAEPVPALRGLPYWDLDYLTVEQTEELLAGMARYQLGFDYDAMRRIHGLTGGHPYLVQVYGAELYRHLAPYGQVTIHAVGDLMPVVLSQVARFFAQEWEGLSREAQVMLAAFGSMRGYDGTATAWDLVLYLRREGASYRREVAERALDELARRRLVHWFGGGAYTMRVELLRAWLAEAKPVDQVLHGKKRRRPRPAGAKRPMLSVDWSAILPWVGVALGVLLVARIWALRNNRVPAVVPLPTVTVEAAPRPTATRVVLPGRIAYMAQEAPGEPWSIWTMRDNGTDPVRMTDGTSEDAMPTWSPDGQELAFISNRGGNRDVWVMSADGTRLRNITNSAADEWTPAWSPDGMDIAFASYRDGNWELYIAKPDGSEVRRLTQSGALDYAPTWSPDGARLAFVSERDGNAEIYSVNRDGSDLQRLTSNQVSDLYPAWSPDGKRIAFASYRDGNMEIYVMEPDGSNPVNLSRSPDSDEHQPSWSTDGKWLTYYSNAEGNWDIYTMLADGSQQVNLTMSAANEQCPVWQPAP